MLQKNKSFTILKILILCVLIFNLTFCYSQNQELELKKLQDKINATKNDSIKIEHLLDLYEYYYSRENNKDSMIAISHRIINIAKHRNYETVLTRTYGNLGKAYRLKRVLDSSLHYNTLSYEIAKQLNNQKLISEALLRLGSYYITINNLSEASNYLIKATEMAEAIHDKSIMAEAYYKLAYAFGFSNNESKEKYYIDKAYSLAKEKDVELTSSIRSAIYTEKMYYFERQRHKTPNKPEVKDSLKYYIDQNYSYGKLIEDPSIIVASLTLKGKLHYYDDEFKKALKYHEEALSYKNNINKLDLINIYHNIAQALIKNDQVEVALRYKDSILSFLSNESNHRSKGEIYRTAYYITKNANKYDLALEYHEKMSENLNKAKEEKQIKALNELEIKYETEKKDAEIVKQKLQNETIKNKARTNYLLLGLVGIIGFSILSLLYLKKKNKALSTELDLANTKATLHRSQINPHFISNSINAIYPFLYDKSDPNKAAAYLSDLSQMIRSILDSTFETTWTIKEELNFIKQYCKIQKLKMDHALKLSIDCSDNLDNTLIPSLLLQPFVENSFLHGFSESQSNAEIDIKITKKGSFILIQIIDNGEAEATVNQNHISRSTEITKQRICSAYKKIKLPEDFLNCGKLDEQGYQVTIKLPDTA